MSASTIGNTRVLLVLAGLPLALSAPACAQPLPPPPFPPGNQLTEPKRVLGKVLFLDEQMSTSNTVACATCHINSRGGSDPRISRNPGPDNVNNTPDDKLASPGVIRADAANNYIRDAIFAISPQVTTRTANSPINAAFVQQAFWDGRASGTFRDPLNNQIVLNNGGALESQIVGPPLSSVEMAHDNMNWAELTTKLAQVRPLALASSIPADVSAVLTPTVTYPQLFQAAFGDSAITPVRIAFAIATYERTLISNDTPWDRTQQGLPGGLTAAQQRGANLFQAQCAVCHTPPTFSNGANPFRNIGLRPPAEDLGRQIVTGNPADRGRFKVPGVRNVGLKASFMHNGMFSTVGQVVAFYGRQPGAPAQFPDNRDPAMNAINIPLGGPTNDLVDFLSNGLRDTRVANQTFPFDRPTLFTERNADRPVVLAGTGLGGTGGIVPAIIADGPGMVGNQFYRVGIDRTLGGAIASLGVSTIPPVGGRITPDRIISTLIIPGSGAGAGPATVFWPLDTTQVTPGTTIFLQWFVDDSAAAGGQALSSVAQVPIFCGSGGCPPPCGYANCDGSSAVPILNINDFVCFQTKFAASDPAANCDGSTAQPILNINDFSCFANKFAAGCN
ncbi:MAG: cytochrome c peroxidase [Phycisphaerales bacterium]